MAELHFHNVHGANISLAAKGHVAQRLQGYGNALVFSHRPIAINERVSIKFLKLSNRTSSTICFGFTSIDPNNLNSDELQHCYHDLFKSGYWIWPLFKNMCIENTILFYYVSRNGEVHFGIDGQEIDSFYKKVHTGGPLWAILDVDGVGTKIELLPSTGDFEEVPPGVIDEEEEEREVKEEALCTVCYQNEINSVLYKCGHMCMCYQCAMQQKQGAGNGQCPMCRAFIKDVIRTYR